MMNTHDEDLLRLYSTGLTSATQNAQIEEHLAICPQCQLTLKEWQALAEVAQLLSHAEPATLPPLQVPYQQEYMPMSVETITSKYTPNFPRSLTTRRIAMVAASFLIVICLFTNLRPLRSFAQDLLAQLFPTTNEAQIAITYNELGTPQEFSTLDSFQEAVPYTIITPQDLPLESIDDTYLYFSGRHVATQQYVTSRLDVWVSQQPVAEAQSNGLLAFSFDLVLPADAEIRSVPLGDTQAELVRGMWVESGETAPSGDPLYRWSSNFWYFSLRWQDSDFVYEIAVMPSSRITADEIETMLLDLARRMHSN